VNECVPALPRFEGRGIPHTRVRSPIVEEERGTPHLLRQKRKMTPRPTSRSSPSSFEACGADPNPHSRKKAASASASATLHRKIRLTGSQLTSSTASLTVSAAEDDDNDNDNDRNSDHVDDDDDEDSFTDLICRHHHHRTERRSVRFRHPPAVLLGPGNHVRRSLYATTISDKGDGLDGKDGVVLVERGGTEQVGSSSSNDRQGLWYSKAEVQGQRHDVQKTIRSLRKHAHCPEGSAHVLLSSASSSSSSCQNNREPPLRSSEGDDAPTRGIASTIIGDIAAKEEVEEGRTSVRSEDESKEHDVCYRGCERYYSLETRFMAQKMVVDAVLDAQARHRTIAGGSDDEKKEEDDDSGSSKEEALRILSEGISKPGRELAHWHATLNAFQCYGFSGMAVSSSAAAAAADEGDRLPSRRSKQKHARAKTLHADTLWWKQAVRTTGHKDGNANPPVILPATTTSPLTSDEDDDESSSDDGSVGGRRREEGGNAIAPTAFAANVVTPPQKHRRSRSMPSPPTEYIFAPTTTNAAQVVATTTTTPRSAACASPAAAFPDRVPHVVPRS
jgi:hypothetical protein